MGLLDEAIREHLDLKRNRGADPNVLAREEHEALGPAVRAPEGEGAEAPAADGGGEAAVGEPAPAAEGVAEEPPGEPVPAEAPPESFAVEPDPVQEHTAVTPPPASDETTAFDADELFAEEDAQVEEPGPQPGEAAAPREPAPREPAPAEPAPREPAPGEPAADDVLEETPEFLQETPEHDRLWFEQKPPKDFDFDG
jgi:hypothetical protein